MLAGPPPGAAVFDFDGVIVDSRAAVATAINGALVEHGLAPAPVHELGRFIGPPVLDAFAQLTGEPAGSPLVAACVDTYHERYAGVYLEQTTLVDGIHALLRAVAIPLALATAKPAEFTGPLLDIMGIAECFRVVCAPTMSTLDESKTVTVARALHELSAPDAVIVGDRCFDIEAGHANGIRAIGVTWGIGDRAELDGADLVLERPGELLAALAPG
jgi:phosphoglycolate phosphatase